jgi:hypothetical protein
MAFPIYYQGQILFRNGSPAMSLDCCCDGRPPDLSECCGTKIEVEYEIYDETNTLLIFQGTYTWDLERPWTATPPEDETIEAEESDFFQVTSGEYLTEQSSRPFAYCFRNVPLPVQIQVSVIVGAYKNGNLYALPSIVRVFDCPRDSEWSDWVETSPHRLRVRLLP